MNSDAIMARDRWAPRPWQHLYVAPIAFALHLLIAYPLVPLVCGNQQHAWLHVVSLVFLAIALFGVVQGAREWQMRPEPRKSDAGDPNAQRHLLAVVGTLLSAIFALGIAAQWFTAFIVPPCLS